MKIKIFLSTLIFLLHTVLVFPCKSFSQEGKAGESYLRIEDAVICQGVVNREPIEPGDIFSCDFIHYLQTNFASTFTNTENRNLVSGSTTTPIFAFVSWFTADITFIKFTNTSKLFHPTGFSHCPSYSMAQIPCRFVTDMKVS